MKISREEKIIDYLSKKTKSIISSKRYDNSGVDAINIALDLKIDRANVSKLLNSLWKQGNLIKIQGRPVLYLDREVIQDNFPDRYIPNFISNSNKLSDYLFASNTQFDANINNANTINTDIDQMIGANGSLREIIMKAKASVAYPPYGLHTIIYGCSGTEKMTLANNMALFAINNHLRSSDAKIATIYCQRSTSSKELENLLFGSFSKIQNKINKGYLQKCEDGFLIMEGIDNLTPEALEIISSLLSQNYYYRYNELTKRELKTMFLCTTTSSNDESNISPLFRFFPTQIFLNNIDSRGSYEKMELILECFSKEARRIHYPIIVSKDILSCFEKCTFENNISQLQNEIRNVCSYAWLENLSSKSKQINISLHNLSPEMFVLMHDSQLNKTNDLNLLNCISKNQFSFDENGNSIEFNQFLQIPKNSEEHRLSQFINEFNFDINNLASTENYIIDNISTLQNCGDLQLNALKKRINPTIFKIVNSVLFQNSAYTNLKDHFQLLYGILLHITREIETFDANSFTKSNEISISKKLYPNDYIFALKIYNELKHFFEFDFTNKSVDFLANYLVIAQQYAEKSNIAILVIAHGESIATEMVNYVKKHLNGTYYLDAIDFRESLQLNDCMELACLKANALNQGSGILILCDTEPLLTISNYVFRETGIQAKTLSSLSLNLLISAVTKSMSLTNDLETIYTSLSSVETKKTKEMVQDDFINKVTDKIISKTVTFIDTKKAVFTLQPCLKKTLKELNIPYSNEIAVKYYCHCVNMLERAIIKQPLENNNVNKYISKNYNLIEIIDKNLKYASRIFNVVIPQSELIYIAEIFEPYLSLKY